MKYNGKEIKPDYIEGVPICGAGCEAIDSECIVSFPDEECCYPAIRAIQKENERQALILKRIDEYIQSVHHLGDGGRDDCLCHAHNIKRILHEQD